MMGDRIPVTQEMIDAVHAHDRAERERVAREKRAEELRQYQEQVKREELELIANVREVWPDADPKDVDALYGIFQTHWERWNS